MLCILEAKCFTQRCIFKVSHPGFGFHSVSILRLGYFKQEEFHKSFQGYVVPECVVTPVTWTICQYKVLRVVSIRRRSRWQGWKLLFICSRLFTEKVHVFLFLQTSNFRRWFSYMMFLASSHPVPVQGELIFCTSFGVREWVCPANHLQLSTSDCAVFLAAHCR